MMGCIDVMKSEPGQSRPLEQVDSGSAPPKRAIENTPSNFGSSPGTVDNLSVASTYKWLSAHRKLIFRS
jgi:hypothetical protein